jgi:uncharacterized protein YukE
MLGMDPEEVLQHSDAVRRAEGTLRSRIDQADRTISGLDAFWRGQDADEFRSAWSAVRHEVAASLLDRLRHAAEELSRHAEEQEHASAADSGGSGATQSEGEEAGDEDTPAFHLSLPGVAFDPGGGATTTTDPAIQAAWDEMSEAEREAVLRQIVEDEVRAYGMNEHLLPDVEVRFFPAWVNGGAISLQGGVIYLSSALLDSPYGLQIAAHEARHQVQYEMIRRTDADPWDWITGDDNSEEYAEVEREYGFTREEIEQWRHEFQPWNYEFPPTGDPSTPEYQEQMQDYLDQDVEVNAREREDEFADEFDFEDLQQVQRDAGVPVSRG